MQLNTAHSKGTSANQSPRFLPAASLGNRGPLFPKIRKTQCAECLCRFLTFDICALIAPCYRAVFLVIVSSSIQGFARLKLSQACFLKLKTELLLGTPFLFSPPPATKKGIPAFLRISIHHWCFWRQLKAFLMETFTHAGKLPRPQDSAKPLMMIESASAPRWKHAESLTLECAARLALRSERWGLGWWGQNREDLEVGGCSLKWRLKCLMGLTKARAAPVCFYMHLCACVVCVSLSWWGQLDVEAL